ncbi:murein hydrolase activator EnvC family protein [Litchfieldella xinjiangensis]|uniref:murein hydrolase activator EnvC family protein n=1 Tax=Litchfieldella xinjiangensis TaxID=1166948 RepID=UPI001E57B7AD|nr:peptidoglycan DD-metalloendopeptidase family protein [Halomonas xinjiangensis]
MGTALWRVAAVGVVAMLASSVLASPVWAAPSEREARERLDAIGSEIQSVSKRLDVARDARDDAEQALRDVETALGETHRRLDTLQDERRRLDDEIVDLEASRRELEAERREQVEAIETQLDALYRLGLSPQLKLLLNQDDPARLDRLQTYLNHLSQARNARLDELAALDARLAENRRALDERSTRLDALQEELAQRGRELSSQVATRQALMADLESRYATEQSRLEALNQDRAHAERVLRQVQEELARLKTPPPSTAIAGTQGDLPWPVQGRVDTTFGSGDGVNRNGIVFVAAEGSPVSAIHAGRVVFADWMRGFGNLLILDHGDGIMTLHAHLQHFSVGPGEAVERGDTLGAVGVSGGRERAALYFEVRRDGDPIDPQRWMARR